MLSARQNAYGHLRNDGGGGESGQRDGYPIERFNSGAQLLSRDQRRAALIGDRLPCGRIEWPLGTRQREGAVDVIAAPQYAMQAPLRQQLPEPSRVGSRCCRGEDGRHVRPDP